MQLQKGNTERGKEGGNLSEQILCLPAGEGSLGAEQSTGCKSKP